ncbi:hypothetical protein EDC94DRAFT_607923 [Helicostylum pulchrum]|nr:hypothetical protein EDC94DRAFT_607923 [Helicostylum pulchrum]
MADPLNMSEEEIDAEIERMQQQLTLALQQIDENFAACNQNLSKLSAEIDRYGEASQEMRNNSQKWLYFLQTMINEGTPTMSDDETEASTNRPVIDDNTKDSFSYPHNRDITSVGMTSTFGGRLRKSLRKGFASPTTLDTTTSGPPGFVHIDMHSPSTSSNTSSMNSGHMGPRLSPPRRMPFSIPRSQLQGTPIREQAIMLTENTLRSIGIRSSDSDSDGGPFHPDTPSRSIPGSQRSRLYTPTKSKSVDTTMEEAETAVAGKSGETSKPWEVSNMDTDDTESRAHFIKFLEQRNKLQDLPSPSVFKQPYLPGTTNKRFQTGEEEDEVMISSPSPRFQTEEPSPRFRSEEEASPRFGIEEEASPLLFRREGTSSSQFRSEIMPSPIRQQQEGDEVAAYEFSDGLAPYSNSYANSFRSGSLTDRSSESTKSKEEHTTTTKTKTARIPAQFDLRYFPEQFRTPPGSIKLTKIYNEFNKRPGTLLNVQDIIASLNDPNYKEEFVSLLINLLARKKFIKKVGNREAWVIRR